MGAAIRRTRRHEKSPAHNDHEELSQPVHRHVAEPSSRLAKTRLGGPDQNNSSGDRRSLRALDVVKAESKFFVLRVVLLHQT